jgi:hypothetical protein
VTTETPLVDLTSKQVGGNVTASELTGLPSGTRSWLGFVGLLPGIQVQSTSVSFGGDSINVNGQSNRNNNFTVDGGGNNDDYLGQSFGGQTRLALEAVQEFQVLTNQFDAEFGRSTGAVVNAVTKQGTNDFHGVGFGYFTESGMIAKDYFTAQNDLEKPDTLKREYGGVIGGPIVRDKAHFLYSLERVELNAGRSAEFPTRPELDYSVVQKTRVWNHLIRFDHQINADNTWGVRYLREDSPTYDGITGYVTYAARRDERDIDETIVATWNTVFGNNKFNTLRASRTYEDNPFAPIEWLNGTPSELPPQHGCCRSRQLHHGRGHAHRHGIRWTSRSRCSAQQVGRRSRHQVRGPTSTSTPDRRRRQHERTFTFSTDRRSTRRIRDLSRAPVDRRAVAGKHGLNSHVAVLRPGQVAAGQLTLNAGLRYDLEIIPMTHQNPARPAGRVPRQEQLAPRVGCRLQPGRIGHSVFRGGYGLFYDKTHLIIMRNFIQAGVRSSFTAQFPASQADRGPRTGYADRSDAGGGPVVNRRSLEQLYPAGTQGATTARSTWSRRIDGAVHHQLSVGYQRQLGPDVAQRRLHPHRGRTR